MHFDMDDLGDELGLSEQDTGKIVEYLVSEGLLVYVALGGTIAVTHQGIKEVERAMATPSQATKYFPPFTVINNTLNVSGNVSNSQVMQASHDSSQSITASPIDVDAVQKVLDQVKQLLPELPEERKKDVSGYIQSAEGQLKVSSPDRMVLKSFLSSIGRLIGGVVASVAAQKAIEAILAAL